MIMNTKSELFQIIARNMEINPISTVIESLEQTGDLIQNYSDYMTTEPIEQEKEMERLPGADYDLCRALLSMVLKEKNGKKEDLEKILRRMIFLLQEK